MVAPAPWPQGPRLPDGGPAVAGVAGGAGAEEGGAQEERVQDGRDGQGFRWFLMTSCHHIMESRICEAKAGSQ